MSIVNDTIERVNNGSPLRRMWGEGEYELPKDVEVTKES